MRLIINILNPILRQYFVSSLKPSIEGLVVSSRTATGMLICALAQPVLRPTAMQSDRSIVVSVPINRITMPMRYRHIALTPKDERAINAVLSREFNIEFNQFLNEGQLLGIRRKELIEIFIEKYNLYDIPSAFETLTKKRYRSKLYALRILGSAPQTVKSSTHFFRKSKRKRKVIVG